MEYWARRNKSTAYPERLIELIRKRIAVIADNPFSGKQANYSDVRESAMGNLSIYYRVTEEKLLVMAFWDNRQDPEKMIAKLRG